MISKNLVLWKLFCQFTTSFGVWYFLEDTYLRPRAPWLGWWSWTPPCSWWLFDDHDGEWCHMVWWLVFTEPRSQSEAGEANHCWWPLLCLLWRHGTGEATGKRETMTHSTHTWQHLGQRRDNEREKCPDTGQCLSVDGPLTSHPGSRMIQTESHKS